MHTDTVLVLSLLLEGSLLGLIIASAYRAWAISARNGLPQIGRELMICILICFTGAVLWFDLFYPGMQFPIVIREWVTFSSLLIGLVSYVAIAMDIEGKYRGIESIRHEIAKYEQRVQGLQDLLDISEEDKRSLVEENDLMKQRLERRERNSVASSLLMAQMHEQSMEITKLGNKLNQVGVSADNAYDAANHSKNKLQDMRQESIDVNRSIADKQRAKDDITDAKLDNIEKTGCENLTVAKDINTKLQPKLL